MISHKSPNFPPQSVDDNFYDEEQRHCGVSLDQQTKRSYGSSLDGRGRIVGFRPDLDGRGRNSDNNYNLTMAELEAKEEEKQIEHFSHITDDGSGINGISQIRERPTVTEHEIISSIPSLP